MERTEASDMECGRGVRNERSYRFRRLDGGVGMENERHPAKAVASKQACAVHLRDRTPKVRLAEVANLPLPTMTCLNRVPFMPGKFSGPGAMGGKMRGRGFECGFMREVLGRDLRMQLMNNRMW